MVWSGRALASLKKAVAFVRRNPQPFLFFAAGTLALLLVGGAVVVSYFSRIVTKTMDGQRWTLPARIYSDVWIVRPGDAVGPDDVLRRIGRLRYTDAGKADPGPGQFHLAKGRLTVGIRERDSAEGRFPGQTVVIEFSGRRVVSVRSAPGGASVPWAVFEPEVVGSVYDEKMQDRTLVKLAEVPKVVVDAIVTTEDRDFFTHSGLSFRRLAGAVFQSVTRGRSPRGTSTLTQQLVKNMFLTPERTLRRKAVEALMAVIVETKYSKDEILEAYLNEIYLGQKGSVSVTGVEEASRFYFGRSVSQLELPEAALLAGLISSPGRYSPFRHPERALERRAFVLKGMLEQQKIDTAAYEKALAAPLTRVKGPVTGIVAPHFVDLLLRQVRAEEPETREDGLAIYTTLDPDMQAAAQTAVRAGLEDLEKKFRRLRSADEDEALQGALIALDPATGAIKALVGGRDYQVSQFNRVVQAKRQPGSLFKPFVYLTAFTRRDIPKPVTAATILDDAPIAVLWGAGEDEAWLPRNYDGEFRGPMTARHAVEQSINIPTVRVALTEVGPKQSLLWDIVQTAQRTGITSPLKPYPSLALGSFETSPLEIASAYAAFANGGFRVSPRALFGYVGPSGRRVTVRTEKLERAADTDALAVLVSCLQGAVDRGTGASARRLGAQGIFAGKTGTTNDGRDAWFIGFSPRLLVAVWVGFDDNRGLGLSGSMAAVPIFADFARRVPSHYYEEPFPTALNVVTEKTDPTTGMLWTERCPESWNELFVAGTEPKERCTVHGGGPIPPLADTPPGPGVGH
ncbi:MAG TPA: PBP1A family penicillin-binding protein [Thermoanaerobaculia bacterium]|nr:PBP1A family penicillin-binding protein [Thermoanaerobaculia bacterium]HQR66357.1 PBP1A family penicillin-binding protein [Thermoanaerobaculia bacterium]